MENDLLIGLGGLILSVLTYFAGVKRTKKQLAKEDKDDRMDAVFARYMEFRKSNYTGGYDGLLKAGVATLESDSEIRAVAARIIDHGEKNPINQLDNADLKVLFTYAVKNKVSFFRVPIEEVIQQSAAIKK